VTLKSLVKVNERDTLSLKEISDKSRQVASLRSSNCKCHASLVIQWGFFLDVATKVLLLITLISSYR